MAQVEKLNLKINESATIGDLKEEIANTTACDEEKQQTNAPLMKSGDCVILMNRSRQYQHITIGSKMTQKINRISNIDLSILRNKPYGSVFELVGHELIERPASSWRSLREETKLDSNHNEKRDNEQLFQHTTNQKLTQTEILKMKSDYQKTDALINKIAESSKTFHLKTEFSKEKYLKSKKAKHSSLLITLVCNASNLCEMYFMRKPDKTMGLRMDALSQILSLANIHCNQHVLCIESCTGLVTASVAERMNGVGKIFNIYCGRNPVMAIADNMFYFQTEKESEIVYNVNIGLFNDPLWIHDSDENDNKLKEIIDSNSKLSKYKDSRPSLYDIKQWIKFEKCDSLILCSRYYPFTLFKHLYRYLDFGCPLVVWCEYIQPLIQIKQWFMENRNKIEAVGLRIHENWFREQQVLPQRTHPMVSMRHLGGYILNGIKVRPRPSNQHNDINDDSLSELTEHAAPSEKKRNLC